MSDGYPVKAGQYLHTDTVSPLATTEGKLHVKAPDLESVIADLATDSRLELVRSLLASLDGKTATEETAEQVKSVLDAISDKVASETTLTQAVEKLNDLLDRLDQKLTIDGEVQIKGQIEASGAHIAPVLGPRIKWQAKLDAVPERMVLGRDGYIYTTRPGSVCKIDPVTGEVVWEHVGIVSQNMRTIVADANGNVYVDSTGTLRVLDKYGEVIASHNFGVFSISGMDIDDDHLYLWLSNVAIVKVPLSDITTEVWRLDSSDGITNVCSAMVVGDEYLYAADSQRRYYKIDKDDGTIEWTYQEPLVKAVFGLALDSDGYLYSGGRYGNTQGNHLTKFDPSGASGPAVVWAEDRQESIIRDIVVYRGALYTVNDAGELGLRDLDGNVVWRVPITDHRINGVAVDHASVYCNTAVDAYIIALDKELQLTGYREVG